MNNPKNRNKINSSNSGVISKYLFGIRLHIRSAHLSDNGVQFWNAKVYSIFGCLLVRGTPRLTRKFSWVWHNDRISLFSSYRLCRNWFEMRKRRDYFIYICICICLCSHIFLGAHISLENSLINWQNLFALKFCNNVVVKWISNGTCRTALTIYHTLTRNSSSCNTKECTYWPIERSHNNHKKRSGKRRFLIEKGKIVAANANSLEKSVANENSRTHSRRLEMGFAAETQFLLI